MHLQIVTFGNGEILKGVFDAIAMCLNPETGTLYTPLIRVGTILSILWAAIYSIWGDYMRAWGRSIIPFIVIPPMLFIPTSTVYIHDVVSNYRDKVDNVPFGLAYLGSFVSTMGYEITKQVDRVFAHVDDLKYHKSGFLMASNLIQQARAFRIVNEDVAENMRQFVTQCVAYEAMLGRKYTIEDLRHSPDIWGLVSAQASPIQSFMWRTPHFQGKQGNLPEIISCRDGVKRFNELWGGELNRATTIFGNKLFGAATPQTAKQELLKYLPVSYSFLSGLSKNADEILKQQMMIYSMVDGIEQKSVALGNSPNFATRRAYLQQRSTYETLGAMASETLITMKAVLEAIAYAAFLFVVPLAVLPIGVRVLISWAQILLWLQMWGPLYAVLNFIMTTTARYKTMGMLSTSSPDGITIASSVGLMNLNADIAAMAGYLAMSIPFLAIALVKGVGSFVHLASHLGTVSQGVAGQAAGELVTGNYNYGNISEGNMQIENSNMLSQSRAASYRAGSTQFIDGRTDITSMADGSQVANVGTSNLPVSFNMAETQSAQLSDMANKSHQRGLNLSESSSQSLASSYRNMVDLSKSLSHSESLGDSMSQGSNVEQSTAIHKTSQMIEDFADQNGISLQKSAELFGAATGGGGIMFKGEAGIKGSLSANDQEFLQKAIKYAEDNNFQEAAREAFQISKNLSHNLSDETSKRLSQGVAGSYETGITQRSEASKSFTEADSLSKQAMNTLSNSSSINANYNQQFYEWLAEQPADHTNGRIGHHAAAEMIANNPAETMVYGNKYRGEKGFLPSLPLGSRPTSIRSEYDGEARQKVHTVGTDSLNKVRQSAETELPVSIEGKGTLLRESAAQQVSVNHTNITEGAASMISEGSKTKQKIEDHKNKSVIKAVGNKGAKEIIDTVPGYIKSFFDGEPQK